MVAHAARVAATQISLVTLPPVAPLLDVMAVLTGSMEMRPMSWQPSA